MTRQVRAVDLECVEQREQVPQARLPRDGGGGGEGLVVKECVDFRYGQLGLLVECVCRRSAQNPAPGLSPVGSGTAPAYALP